MVTESLFHSSTTPLENQFLTISLLNLNCQPYHHAGTHICTRLLRYNAASGVLRRNTRGYGGDRKRIPTFLATENGRGHSPRWRNTATRTMHVSLRTNQKKTQLIGMERQD
ncbi:hypothetical protein E2C01_062911 [Portunus trituberculatus]|uniref:Uncharacterized protein n=1 Tax=Portunus trituberculatus TaxID=210409 RepID=A0A5B7HHD2_PORTR|nr:hypothetical protein [Portunus trituberculatus]